ncbi:MAG: hypothetical protein M0Z81_07635 [Deltaproteobacteria bacterium]|jgi:hypothetical protein|nr:hypothetical protein [Deltaproteobacteria bacterium]
MKSKLRFGGIGMMAVGAVLALIYFISGPKPVAGKCSLRMVAKEKVITGAYKTYAIKDAPLPLWLAKTVFHNGTAGRVTDLKIRYRVSEYTDWSSWHDYVAVDPDQTVVDLYYPIFTSACAKLTSRAPAELQMQTEYIDGAGGKHRESETRRIWMLDRHEFIFSDLTSEERTGSFQDQNTYAPLLAAWVSRGDDVVSRLAAIANKKAGGLGASTDDESCIKVMASLYEIMRTIHISYQHPPALIDPSLSYDIKLVQSLQYPRDTIQKRSGTCIDLAILYAAMLNSVNIQPYLVVIDGHCFPMAKTPGGKLIGVETTGVGDGYAKSMDFARAVESAAKTLKKVAASGRFVIVDLREEWTSGIPNPELDPLPPNILEEWGIMALLETPAGTTAAPEAAIEGWWAYSLTTLDGRVVNGQIVVRQEEGGLLIIATASYRLRGADGIMHRVRERNVFQGLMQGQNVSAECNSAIYTLDGVQVQAQGLPLRLDLVLGDGGQTMQGRISNNMGMSVPIHMHKK